MKNILNALKLTFKDKTNILFFISTFIILLSFYIAAIEASAGITMFFKANSLLFIVLQILLSIMNALFAALVLTLFVEILKTNKKNADLNIFQAISSLLLSVITTGCYVCGTLLLPTVGLAASLSSLPFAGLEVKIVTLLLLIYSLSEITKKYLGICKISTTKYNLSLGSYSLRISNTITNNLKPVVITLFSFSLLFILPSILPDMNIGLNNSDYICHAK